MENMFCLQYVNVVAICYKKHRQHVKYIDYVLTLLR